MAEEDETQELVFRLADGSERRLKNWRAINRFLDDLEAAWSWLSTLTREQDPAGLRDQVPARIQHLRNEAQRQQNAGAPPLGLEGSILTAFNDSQGPFLPDSENGRTVLDIHEAAGAEAGVTALAFLRGQLGMGSITRLEQLRGIMMAAVPGMATMVGAGTRLAKERENFRSAARRLEGEVQSSMQARATEWEERLQQTNSTANALGLRLGRRWLKRAREWHGLNEKSVDSIRAVEQSYREFMKLKAPVEYWDDKASAHRESEHALRWIVGIYFVVAMGAIVYIFREAAIFILNESTPTRDLPSGLFFIISAGLASAAGLLFWVGRILTKLYLSEHHLRHDAEERAKMTQTYLALTAEGAASDADRQIILTALFRNTPDGIVKDDGGFDPSIPAAIARLGMR